MLSRLSLLLLFLFSLLPSMWMKGEKISDMGRALEYCHEAPLDRIEGIWEFPEDNTAVLIRLSDQRKRKYDLIVITTPDCRLNPGEKIGEMTGSVDPDKFHLSLFTTRRDGLLSDPGNCMAIFNENDGSLRVEKRKFKISLRNARYLPNFWKMLSIFRFSSDNPVEKLPTGLTRLFPNPYSDKIEKGFPKYL